MEDELIRRFRRGITPHRELVFEFTKDPACLHQYYDLRERMYAECLGLKHFSGAEDESDRNSMILIARKGNQVVGGARMNIRNPRNETLLPMEEHGVELQKLLPELELEHTTYCEFSRLARLPDYRGAEFAVQMNRAFKRKAIAHGVQYCFVLASQSQTRNYRRINLIDRDEYIIRDDIGIYPHPIYEGLKMVLSYLEYPPVFEGMDEYNQMHMIGEEPVL